LINDKLKVLSTRLFPKGQGAEAYRSSGIASRCDWIVYSDRATPYVYLSRGEGLTNPKTIFLSLRNAFEALIFFANEVLPQLNSKFVLVSGSVDMTVPRQVDKRWRKYSAAERSAIKSIQQSPFLCHWFAENLDDDRFDNMSPIPLGMVFPVEYPEQGIVIPDIPKLGGRQPRVLCAHRERDSAQWELRRQVTSLAKGKWARWCTVLESEVSEREFLDLVKQHAFVFCVNGGGLDPSPKAWQTMLHGAIPIIKHTTIDAAYEDLPVAFVDKWTAESLTLKKLFDWHRKFSSCHDISSNREEILKILSIDHWWEKIIEKLS